MLRRLSAVGVSLGVLLTASLAHAQANSAHGFGQQGEFIFSADRLMPLFAYTNQKTSLDPGGLGPGVKSATQTVNQTNLSFFWGSTYPNEIFYTIPRVGFDYTIVDNVTIGGDLIVYFTLGGSTDTHVETTGGTTTDTSTHSPGSSVFGIAPRGGYIIGLSDLFAIWLRGGFSYYTGSTDALDGNGNKIGSDGKWVFALDLDPQFVIVPMQHFAFTVGPALDIPLTGKVTSTRTMGGTTTSTSNDYSQFGFAINVGLMGWIGG